MRSLRKTAIDDGNRDGAAIHEVRGFAGHSQVCTTELHFVRAEEDAEAAAHRIQTRIVDREDR
jgi:hypothetical protein